jgi:hypothetical protein
LGEAKLSVGLNKKPTMITYRRLYIKVLTKADRKQIKFSKRKVYRRILGSVYENKKENWRIFTNKEIYTIVKTPL